MSSLEIFDTPLCQRSFFVREIYNVFFEKIIDGRDLALSTLDPKGLGVWITGTPRIGKSVFLYYFAKRLFEEKKIEFVITIGDTWYNSRYEKTDSSLLTDLLEKKSVVHLIDPKGKAVPNLREHNAFAVFFASPTDSNVIPYHSKNLLPFYMPLWKKPEMIKCYNSLGETFDPVRFDKWGGIFVDAFRDRTLDAKLQEVLQSSDLRVILSNLHSATLQEKVGSNQWLLHRHPSDDYRCCEIQLPSAYVEEKVLGVLDKVNFLSILQSNDSILGKLYEQHVFKHLLTRNSSLDVTCFNGRATRANEPLKLEIGGTIMDYSNTSTISEIEDNTLCRPKEKNKMGVDAVLLTTTNTAWAIQITISDKHKAIDISSVSKQFPLFSTLKVLIIHPSPSRAFVYPSVIVNGTEIRPTRRFICQYSAFFLSDQRI